LFPSGFLESLTLQKTYTPDRPADFSGGSVEIDTKDYPDRFTAKVSAGSSLNTQSTLADGFLSYTGGRLDFLGIDDGSRDLPGMVKSELGGLGGSRLPTGDPVMVERIGESFLGGDLANFAPRTGTGPGNLNWGFSLGNRTELFGNDFGFLVSGTYSSSYHLRDNEVEREWRTSAFDPERLAAAREEEPNVDYTFLRGTHDVNLGGIGNFTFLPSPNHQFGLKTLYKRNGEDEARRFQGANREDLGGLLVDERLRFIARTLAWGQLSGQHQLGDTRLEWRGTVARATREEPGLREVIFRRSFSEPEGAPFYLDNEGPAPRYLFNALTDDDLNGAIDYTIPVGAWGDEDLEMKVGGMARVRDRDFEARRFRWDFRGQFTSLDAALTPDRVVGAFSGSDQFVLDEIIEPGDDYVTDDRTLAGYGMVTIPLGPVEIVGGVRVETYDLELDAQGGDQDAELTSTDVLPSLNVTYEISDRMNLRAGVSETLDRPEFRELAPFQFTEATSLRQVFGNPELKIAQIRNFDLRWGFYPSADEVVTVGGFYKELKRPIEQVFITTAGAAYSYQNSEEGRLLGAELGARKNLGFLADVLSPFSLGGNFAVIDSEVTVSPEGIFNPTNLQRPLEGQSPWTANATLAFQRPEGGTEAGLYLNVFGERITAGGGAGLPDIKEQPRPQLDLTITQPLRQNFQLTAKAENLLDAEYRWEQSANGVTRVQRSYREGRTFSLSVSFETY
ncbi:MAG: TonB-dependent receptor, partial [Gemmatimonadetes bacterium]|nr:TonB-dependent receptor [Gemmatimonadota bacterium]NIR79368.1 TonB-dependent receptor [Gemmatimonadota bacterium]NIT88049.1 TonB-dependent receptor [Gemmatimonadota bacterium]NIU31881.1 TonB-dependent receptor [Gemmatimonadota bacterium]NIU36492.1 TonB-dependent receptor [Gemmatimonadota bacterium]